MLTGLLHAHSGLRYLVLLAGVAALAYSIYGVLTKRSYDKGMRISATAFAGLLHLQILVGFFLLVSGRFFGALIGHLFMMLAAGVVAQIPISVLKRRPLEERSHMPHLIATSVALLLVWGGVAAIGRGLLQASF